MVAELHAEAETSDQVDHEDCIHLDGIVAEHDVEHPAYSHQLEKHEENAQADDQSQRETTQDLHRHNNGADSDKHILEEHTVDVGVLVVVDVVKTVGEGNGRFGFVSFCLHADRLDSWAAKSDHVCELLDVSSLRPFLVI